MSQRHAKKKPCACSAEDFCVFSGTQISKLVVVIATNPVTMFDWILIKYSSRNIHSSFLENNIRQGKSEHHDR